MNFPADSRSGFFRPPALAAVLLPALFLFLFPAARPVAQSMNSARSTGKPRFSADRPAEALAEEILAQMSDEDALAQTFMLGWVGAEPSPLIMDWIRDRRIGGVKIFGWNTDDTRKLAETVGVLQSAALEGDFGIPLLVATDQEGGWIRHVKGATSETPGNMAIGASGYPRDAYLAGYYIGRELAVLGINMNFAPTVDLYTNSASTLIGPRSFGSDPVQAGILGAAFVRGHEKAGVIATAKHYPGHGDTDLDSHGVLPEITAPFEVLWERELVPYRMLARENIPAVMSGHLAFPNTQAASTPASLSPWFLRTVLRDRIGFKGLVITDDLMMNGATLSAGSLSRAARQAFMAGNDIIMVSKTPNLNDPIWTSLVLAMREEAAFRERVRDAARRVLVTKLKYLRGGNAVPYVPDLLKVDAELPNPEGSAFFLSLAARSVTVVRGNLPLAPEKAGKVLLAGQFEDFFSAGKKAYPGAASYYYSASRGNAELSYYAREADTVIFCISDASDLGLLRSLQGSGKKVYVFSVLSPAYIEEVPWTEGAIAVYSYAPESFVAGFSALLGRIPAPGKLPFSAGGNAAPRNAR
ncbi:MAG: glycoside hydrolase family 3 protein [Spirochaetaceae bacterium]|jgi:beta-N-acetylhexosaminidase|nr:glycoside hydrolase family 3 protein [Spirochaetaceae bacterium]